MRWLFLAVALAFATPVAHAADGAQFAAIGYSPDSRYFAFEQYGIQDGSGSPYADVFVIDTEKNAWMPGSPFRELREEDEKATVGMVHTAALARAAALLKSLAITEPAALLAALPATQVAGARNKVAFDLWYNSMGGTAAPETADTANRFELALTTAGLPRPASCDTYDEPVKGFTLTIQRAGEAAQTLNSDTSLPASRGCAVDYDIAAVVAPTGYPKAIHLVAIIAVYTRGFEGQDRRYIAVPFQAP